MHGVLAQIDNHQTCHRRLLPRSAFTYSISTRPRLVSLAEALINRENAITVDDATNAGAMAAMDLRKAGHEVTFFVNPYYIETRTDYFFCKLNAVLDAASKTRVEFLGEPFDIALSQRRGAFRSRIKRELLRLRREEDRIQMVDLVAEIVGAARVNTPPHLKTIEMATLRELISSGVRIENHGWSHVDFSILNFEEIKFEIEMGREWLQRSVEIESRYFAVPDGKFQPSGDDPYRLVDTWFLADPNRELGWISRGVYNRSSIDTIEDLVWH